MPQHLHSPEMQHVRAHACVSVVGRWKRSNPEGVCCTGTQREQGVTAKRGEAGTLTSTWTLDQWEIAGGQDLSLNIRLRGLRQMIGISSALPTTSDCLSLYLLSVRLVPQVPPNLPSWYLQFENILNWNWTSRVRECYGNTNRRR